VGWSKWQGRGSETTIILACKVHDDDNAGNIKRRWDRMSSVCLLVCYYYFYPLPPPFRKVISVCVRVLARGICTDINKYFIIYFLNLSSFILQNWLKLQSLGKWFFCFREPLGSILMHGLKSEYKKKGKTIPVTGRRGPYGCETSKLPHFLDNRLREDGEFVSLTRRPPFTSRKIPGTHFC
jgi:hypothetical protein